MHMKAFIFVYSCSFIWIEVKPNPGVNLKTQKTMIAKQNNDKIYSYLKVLCIVLWGASQMEAMIGLIAHTALNELVSRQ